MRKLPQRPREHVLETESQDFVKRVLPSEWVVSFTDQDYGIDVQVEIVQGGHVTGAAFSIQLKGTDSIKKSKGRYVSHSCKTSTLQYFLERQEPVIYLVYDARTNTGYWIWIKEYIRNKLGTDWKNKNKNTILIPLRNTFDDFAVKDIMSHVLTQHDTVKWLAATQDSQNPFYKYNFTVADEVETIIVAPRYPGAENDCPVEIKTSFRFDDSPEAQMSLDVLTKAFKTGSPAKIAFSHIDKIEMPDAFSDLFAHVDEFRPSYIELGPASSGEQLLISMLLIGQDGQTLAQVPYVDLREVQSGTEEATYSNEQQNIPFKFILQTDVLRNVSTMRMRIDSTNLSVVKIREVFRFHRAIAQADRMRIVSLTTGLSSDTTIDNLSSPEIPQGWIELIEDAAFIQEKLNQVILWPKHLTEFEAQLIHDVANILRTGRLEHMVHEEKPEFVSFDVPTATTLNFINAPHTSEAFQLGFDRENCVVDLLGVQLELGRCLVIMPNVRLDTASTLELGQLGDPPEDSTLRLTCQVGPPGTVYLFERWHPRSQET